MDTISKYRMKNSGLCKRAEAAFQTVFPVYTPECGKIYVPAGETKFSRCTKSCPGGLSTGAYLFGSLVRGTFFSSYFIISSAIWLNIILASKVDKPYSDILILLSFAAYASIFIGPLMIACWFLVAITQAQIQSTILLKKHVGLLVQNDCCLHQCKLCGFEFLKTCVIFIFTPVFGYITFSLIVVTFMRMYVQEDFWTFDR